jgi:hypothetical protein
MTKSLIAISIAIAAAASASAAMITTSSGPYSDVAGACTVDFDGSTCAGVNYLVAAGSITTGSVSGVTAQPPGSTGNYLTVGPTIGTPVDITIDAGADYNYFGLLAGSLDSYNAIAFTLTDNSVLTFTGTQLAAAANQSATGNQQQGIYWNIFLGSNVFFNQIRLTSTQNAFESDNHAFAKVPVPATLGLLGLGLLGLGAIGRRRG